MRVRSVVTGQKYVRGTVQRGDNGREEVDMAVIRAVIGDTIRATRLRQRRTLRQVSTAARVSLGYLSEIERGQKEPSSELLAAICAALDVPLSDLFAEVSDTMRREEKRVDLARHAAGVVGGVPVSGPPRLSASAPRRLMNPAAAGGRLAPPPGPVRAGVTRRGLSRPTVPAS